MTRKAIHTLTQSRAGSGAPALSLLLLLAAGCDNGLTAPATTMVALPGGALTMGSTSTCTDSEGVACGADHGPHPVKLSAFSLDKTEVTRLQYANCVVAGACPESNAPTFDAAHKNDPVTVNDPAAARDYCEWRGLGLPTEAQFEFASRVASDGTTHDYPWGDTAPTCDRVAYAGCGKSAAVPVGTTPGDVSGYGVMDLAGSVPEWVEDAYDQYAGCLDRFGWSDICSPDDVSCPEGHCADSACLRGCFPPADEVASTMQGSTLTDTPQCAEVPSGSTPIVDPVLRTQSTYGVVRGAGALDRQCGLAGWSRQHATPGLYYAGFRCARISGGGTDNVPTSYRFALSGCPTSDYPVTLSITNSDSGAAVDFVLDHVGATGEPGASVNSDGGSVRLLPCGDSFIVRPATNVVLKIAVADAIGCAAWSQTVGLRVGGDVPARGVDLLPLAGLSTNLCTLPNAMGSCAGTCKVDTCSTNYRNCDGTFVDGCEVNVSSDSANCGACGNQCASQANATVACVDATCRIAACSARFADCDGTMTTGCEVDTANDPVNCGACATVCSSNHITTPVCSAGSCTGLCDSGYADCDGNKLVDGCEVSVATDVANCGGCGTACSQNHVAATCSSGQCGGRCAGDYADCNNDKRTDGCEVDLDTDSANCGGCGVVCGNGKSCANGLCN